MDSGHLVKPGSSSIREVVPGVPLELNSPVAHLPTWLPPQESALREYLRVLIKRKWTVIGCLVAIFSVVTIATLKMTPIYRASGSIVINRPDYNLVNFKDSGNMGSEYYDPTDLDTEVNILQSDLLASQVISTLKLQRMPEFGGKAGSAPVPDLSPDSLEGPDPARTASLLGAFKSGLRVSLKPNTRIVIIQYTSTNPQLSASIVNTLAKTYIEQSYTSKFDSTMKAADWLTKQLVDVKMNVELSQEKLVKYQKEHEILGTDEKQNIITEKLGELNKELTAAESNRMEKESLYRLIEAGDADSVANAASVLESAGTSGSASPSSLLASLRAKQADLKIQIAELGTQFGPAYPKVAQLNGQLGEIDRQLQLELKTIANRIKGEYLTALQQEQMLGAQFEKQKQEANKLNESAIEYSILKREADTYRQLYEGLQQKLKEATVTAGLKSSNIRQVDAARAPTAPSEPNIPRNLAFALVLGLTSGIGLAFLLENMDNTVRTTEQAQVVSGLPPLGMIPLGSANNASPTALKRLTVAPSKEVVELVTVSRPQSQMAESYRALRTSLLLSSLGAPPKVIMITSARPQEGKTTTSINVAIVLAQKGVRVLLVDADLRRPSVHKTLGMGPRSGLSNVLTGSATLEQTITRSPILPNLSILAAGTPPPNPAELLASSQMKDMLDDLREQYDHIVIDTPPTLSVTDAVVLSPRVDSVVLVIRSGQTTKQALRRSRDILAQVNARVTGVLLNAVDLSSPDYYYYYEYQGKYGDVYYREEDGGHSASDDAKTPSSESA